MRLGRDGALSRRRPGPDGRQDALIPVAHATESGSRIAGSQVEIIDDRGHVMRAGRPEALWTAVSKFLTA